MLTTESALQICPRCEAPNLVGLVFCSACGVSLTDTQREVPRREESASSCPRCREAIPGLAEYCPDCGRYFASVQQNMVHKEADVPEGWQARPLPNGSVIVRRVGLNSWKTPAVSILLVPSALAIALGIGLFVPQGLVASHSDAVPVLLILFGGCTAAVLTGLLLPFFLLDQIRVGQGFLEVRREFGLYRFRRRIERSCFRTTTKRRVIDKGRGGTSYTWVRTLCVENGGRPLPLLETEQDLGFYEDNGDFAGDTVMQLGLYLASITGWNFYYETGKLLVR